MKPLFGSNETENPSPETVLSATRSVPAGAVAAKRAAGVVPAQRQLVGGDFIKCVEQSLPFAELVTHREQQFAAQGIDLFGFVAQRHGGGGLRSHVETLDRAAQHGCPSEVISQSGGRAKGL